MEKSTVSSKTYVITNGITDGNKNEAFVLSTESTEHYNTKVYISDTSVEIIIMQTLATILEDIAMFDSDSNDIYNICICNNKCVELINMLKKPITINGREIKPYTNEQIKRAKRSNDKELIGYVGYVNDLIDFMETEIGTTVRIATPYIMLNYGILMPVERELISITLKTAEHHIANANK